MLKTIRRYILLIGFTVFLCVFSLIDILSPAKEFSVLENRPLAQSPLLTGRAILDNSYTLKYEEYVNDQFVARDKWITLKSLSESALGKLENNGVLYGEEHYLFERAFTLDDTQLKKNLEYIKSFARMYGGNSVTLTIIPNSYAILPQKLPRGAPVIDQLGIIRDCYQVFSGELRVCDIIPALQEHSSEPVYYRTDHHWTTLGAYIGYTAFMDSLGDESIPLESLTSHETPGFYGTYYSKAKNWNAIPDTIIRYDIPVAEVLIDGVSADGLYDLEAFEKRDKYAAFLHGNNGLTVIKSAWNTSRNAERKKILIFKDSYGNCLVPFLAYSFDEVHVADLRYFDGVPELLSNNDYSEIYIMYNFAALAQDANIYKLVKTAAG